MGCHQMTQLYNSWLCICTGRGTRLGSSTSNVLDAFQLDMTLYFGDECHFELSASPSGIPYHGKYTIVLWLSPRSPPLVLAQSYNHGGFRHRCHSTSFHRPLPALPTRVAQW